MMKDLPHFFLLFFLPGQVFDSESGLFQNHHREYQGLKGGYTQVDPIGLAGGINTFAYALSQPTLLTDRLGLDTEVCTRRFWPGVVMPYARHCFIRFDGNPKDTLGFDNSQVGQDAAPSSMGTCEKTKGEENDDCVKREMKKCDPQVYDFAKFNCCQCAQAALEACGLTAPNWPNWPINPAPPNTPRPEPGPKKL